MTLRFDDPRWLLLAIAFLPAIPLALRWFAGMSVARRMSAIALRAVLIGLMLGCLAGATSIRRTERLAVIALVDASESVRLFARSGAPDGPGTDGVERARAFLERAAAERGPDDLLGLVSFGEGAVAVATPGGSGPLDRPLAVARADGTRIDAALRLGAAMFPADASRRLVLLSDGVQTGGDVLAAARELRARLAGSPEERIPVDVVPWEYDVAHEVVVESVDAPTSAPMGSVVSIRVTLSATGPTTGSLRLLEERTELDLNGTAPGYGRPLSLDAGRTTVVLEAPLSPRRLHRFEAVFEPDDRATDTVVQNNRAEAFTVTPGRGVVMIVTQGAEEAPGLLARTLQEEGFEVRTVAPEALDSDVLALQTSDLVILDNMPAEALSARAQQQLVGYVTMLGGGLVMLGGHDAFGAGGWKGSPVEPILPVLLDLPDRLVSAAAAVVIVLDSSGSMGRSILGSSRTQQEIANEGASAAVRTLDRTDLVGVIAFDNRPRVVVDLAPNRDPDATAEAIRRISSGGGTNLPPALREAHRQLLLADAQVRHVVVLSDGRSMGEEALPRIARDMHADGISISTIAVGDGADTQALAALAAAADGTYYRVVDPTILPRIFLKAVRVVRTPFVREEPFTPAILATGSPLVTGLDATPPLLGLTLTQMRAEPTVTNAMATPGGEPVLAHWYAGLGQVVAFTSDASTWAEPWQGWPGFRRLWGQIARTASRPLAQRGYDLGVSPEGDAIRVRLTASGEQGGPVDLLSVPGTVYAPDGSETSVALVQSGPGEYEALVPAPEVGVHVVALSPRLGTTRMSPVIGGFSRPPAAELRSLRSDRALLDAVASTTGGRVLDPFDPANAKLFDRTGIVPREARTPLWPVLLAWTIVVLLLDVATRRIAWDRLLVANPVLGLPGGTGTARGAGIERAVASRRGRARTPGDAPVLTETDAARLAADAARNRRQRRRAAPVPSSEQAPDTDQGTGGGTVGQAEGLRAARERARQRFTEPRDEAAEAGRDGAP